MSKSTWGSIEDFVKLAINSAAYKPEGSYFPLDPDCIALSRPINEPIEGTDSSKGAAALINGINNAYDVRIEGDNLSFDDVIRQTVLALLKRGELKLEENGINQILRGTIAEITGTDQNLLHDGFVVIRPETHYAENGVSPTDQITALQTAISGSLENIFGLEGESIDIGENTTTVKDIYIQLCEALRKAGKIEPQAKIGGKGGRGIGASGTEEAA